MKCTAIGRTDLGLQRKQNEDAFLVDDKLGLYAVCDGMGGHAAGEVAAEAALENLARELQERIGFKAGDSRTATPSTELAHRVEEAVQEANVKVFELAKSNRAYAGMGTTLTMMLVTGHRAVVAHVGDSRLYLSRNGETCQLTDDHTFMNEIIGQGLVDPLADRHCLSHILTRAVGTRREVTIDTLAFDLLPSDVCLLCSDGLTQSLRGPEELQQVLDEYTPDEAAEHLIELANSRGGGDNVTVVVVTPDFDGEDRRKATNRADQIEETVNALHSAFLFHDLPMSELLRVLDIVEVHRHKTGECLLRRGQTALSYSLVFKGTVARQVSARSQPEVLGRGQGFGAESLLDNHASSATYKVIEPATIVRVPYDRLGELMHHRPRIGLRLYHQLTSTGLP